MNPTSTYAATIATLALFALVVVGWLLTGPQAHPDHVIVRDACMRYFGKEPVAIYKVCWTGRRK